MLLRRCTTAAVSIMKKANSISRIFGTCCLASSFKYRVPYYLDHLHLVDAAAAIMLWQ